MLFDWEVTILDIPRLRPGEDCYSIQQDGSGTFVNYVYCSFAGGFFQCSCRTLEEAHRRCEKWLEWHENK